MAAGAWEQDRSKGVGAMMQEVEQPVQPLRPDALWPQHPPGVSEASVLPDPGAHAGSAFAPPQPPYSDGNAMALLQHWWSTYYAAGRALPPGHQPHNGTMPGGFAPPAAPDPSQFHAALPHLLQSMGPKAEGSGHAFTHPSALSASHGADPHPDPTQADPAGAQLPVNGLKTAMTADQNGTDTAGNSMLDASGSMGEPKDAAMTAAEAAFASGSGDLGSRGSGAKCAKEKNRQAQRRFRERQKGLISDLKDRNDALAKQVGEQARALEALEKENMMLKTMMGDAAKSHMLPPAQLQHMQALSASHPQAHHNQQQAQQQQAQQSQPQHQQQQQQQQHQQHPGSAVNASGLASAFSPLGQASAAAAHAQETPPQQVHAPTANSGHEHSQHPSPLSMHTQAEPLTQAPTSSPEA